MTKNVLIISTNGFEDVELVLFNDILNRSGFNVTIAFSSEKDFAVSSYGLKVLINHKFIDVVEKLNDFDALFIPGGSIIEGLDNDKLTNKIIKHFDVNKKIIGAICAAPVLLAKRGILNNKKAICYPDKSLQKILIKNGALLSSTNCKSNEDCSVVIDENIITGLDMKTSFKFSYEFVKLLEKKF